MTYTYNDFRRETVITNERGQTKRVFLSVDGMPIKTIDANGGQHINVYSEANPLQKISSSTPLGYVTSYAYDAMGNITQVTLPSGNTQQFSYFNAFSKPGKIKDARGNYALIKYDARGNVLHELKLKNGFGASIDPATYTPLPSQIISWTFNTYDSYGNVLTATKVRDFATQAGPAVEYDYNDTVNGAQGLHAVTITRRGDKNGDGVIGAGESDTVNLSYDALGRATQAVNDNWYPTQFTYDALDRVIRGTDDKGKLRDYEFDANGNPTRESLTIAGALIDQTVTFYDLSDRKQTSTDAGGFVTQYGYDEAGNVIKTTNPDTYSIAFAYDANNNVIMAYDEEDHAALKTLDLDGKPRAVTDANNITTQSEYYGPARDGRLKTQIDAVGRKTTYDYDANGNTVSVTDNLGRITLTTYDELNRPVRMVGPVYTDSSNVGLGAIRPVTKNSYDNLGNLTRVDAGRTDITGTNAAADVVAPQMSYVYDDFGRKIKEIDPLGKEWVYEYDINNNVTKTTGPKGQVITASYYYGGLLHTQTAYRYPGDPAPQVTTYTRNDLGQVTQAQSPAVTYSQGYDAAHRLQTVTDSRGSKALTYTYSNAGRLKRLQDNEGKRTDYLYDPVGRLTGLWAANDDLVTFIHDRGGRLTEKWFPSGANTRYTYNDDNTLRQLVNGLSGSATVYSRNEYTYDGVGNRKTATEVTGTITTAATNEIYGYDPLGNRSYKTTTGGATFYYVYDAANQLKEVHTGSITGTLTGALIYDANGNVTQKCEGGTVTTTATSCSGAAITNFSYDVYNRLTQVAKTGLATQTYGYDHQGRRISKTVGSATTYYLYNGDNLYGEYASWTTAAARYTHGPGTDDPIIRATASANQYYHKDGLGSVVAMSDSIGATLGTQLYDAWGNKSTAGGSAITQYGYTGREPDETGLIYYRARYYDPSIGRFVQRDPVGLDAGLNFYAYVKNNPINSVDPTGLRDILIHGTMLFGLGDTSWYQPGSNFSSAIGKATGEAIQEPFAWSGGNSDIERLKAAASLAYYVNTIPQTENVNLIAHSHGGNVEALASQWINRPVNVVTLGTPVLSEYKFDMTNVKEALAISSDNDFVQSHGGNTFWLPFLGEFGPAGRERSEPGLTNIVSPVYKGHSDYHENSDYTAQLIGNYFSSGGWRGSSPVSIGPTYDSLSGSSDNFIDLPNPFGP